MSVGLVISLVSAVLVLIGTVLMAWGYRLVPRLNRSNPSPATIDIPVSLVVAARNEEEKIGQALRTWMAQDHPTLEIIVVNDRSEDNTAKVIREVAGADPRVCLVEIEKLPFGWLGKNHALRTGASLACGEFILFTDADVCLLPDTVSRTLSLVQQRRIDHLAGLPRIPLKGLLLTAFVTSFGLFFSLLFRPWKASDPRSDAHIGVGAFNFVRREAYEAVGGHERIRLRPDDDVSLGKILKRAGFRQSAVEALDHVQVEWYSSVGQMVEGLMKNAFVAFDYSVGKALLACLAHAVIHLWPFLGVLTLSGTSRLLCGLAVGALTVSYLGAAYRSRNSLVSVFLLPVAVALSIYVILKAMLRTLANGGIVWRGTFYSLDELRSGLDTTGGTRSV